MHRSRVAFSTPLIVVLISLLLVSCSPNEKETSRNEISDLEKELFSNEEGTDMKKANELIKAYMGFADEYPEDESAPDYLFKAGEIAMNMNLPQTSVQAFDKIITKYPDFEKAAQCLFLKAFVFENLVGDLAKAEEFYKLFLEKYPEDDFADDAEVSLKFLGKSPEELIKEFEKIAEEE